MTAAEVNPREPSMADQLYRLQQDAYMQEAVLIGCLDFPPLRESSDDLSQSADRFLVCMADDMIVGALSFNEGTACTTITRLVVSPRVFRCGIATALLRELEGRVPRGRAILVTTAGANAPAVSLYKKLGYSVAFRSNSPEGIPLVHFCKQRGR